MVKPFQCNWHKMFPWKRLNRPLLQTVICESWAIRESFKIQHNETVVLCDAEIRVECYTAVSAVVRHQREVPAFGLTFRGKKEYKWYRVTEELTQWTESGLPSEKVCLFITYDWQPSTADSTDTPMACGLFMKHTHTHSSSPHPLSGRVVRCVFEIRVAMFWCLLPRIPRD